MAAFNHHNLLRKKLLSELVSLKKDHADLKKILVERSQCYKLTEAFLSRLETRQSAGVGLENKVLPPDDVVKKLQKDLNDALRKNEKWQEYDLERQAYVRAILDRVSRLETMLEEQEQHNEEHSDEKMNLMQEHYESLLAQGNDELNVLREQFDLVQQNLTVFQSCCQEKEREIEELNQLLQTQKMGLADAEDEGKHLNTKTKDLQKQLEKEKRKSANSEHQASLCLKLMFNRHHANQKKIRELQRQVQISALDLEDEKQNTSYLKKQMVRLLRTLQRKKDVPKVGMKREGEDHSYCEEEHPDVNRHSKTSTPQKNLMEESFLKCPNCPAKYPVDYYRDLMEHLDICLE